MEDLNDLSAQYAVAILRELDIDYSNTAISVCAANGPGDSLTMLILTCSCPDGTLKQRTYPLPSGIEIAVVRCLRQALAVRGALTGA